MNNGKILIIAILVILVTVIFETSVARLYYFSINTYSTASLTVLFVVILLIYLVAQNLILRHLQIDKSDIPKEKHRLYLIRWLTFLVQYAIIASVLYVTAEMISTSKYHIIMLLLIVTLSYGLSIFLTSLLTYRFLSWYRRKKNRIVFTYGLSFAILTVNSFSTVLSIYTMLPLEYTFVLPNQGLIIPYFPPGSIASAVNNIFVITTVFSFVILWAATVLLLRHYLRNLRGISYWIISALPLVYFLLQFQPIFLTIISVLGSNKIVFFGSIYALFFTLSKPVGGILFGIAFWAMSKQVQNRSVKGYLVYCAFGLVMLFVSNQAIILITAPYPPFGLLTTSIFGLASYLIVVGLLRCVISMSGDIDLRRSIKNTVKEQFNLLGNISSAEVEGQTISKVILISRNLSNQISDEVGIEPSLSEDEIKGFCKQVIEELKRKK